MIQRRGAAQEVAGETGTGRVTEQRNLHNQHATENRAKNEAADWFVVTA